MIAGRTSGKKPPPFTERWVTLQEQKKEKSGHLVGAKKRRLREEGE